MKKIHLGSMITKSFTLGFLLVWSLATVTLAAPLPVALGSCSTFAVLAGSSITFTNGGTINGDIGVYPGSAYTPGVPPPIVNGTIHLADSTAAQAQADLTTAYNDAAGRPVTATIGTELGGTTITPGVYNSAAGDFGITGTLTLDGMGDTTAVFIFKVASTLITASSSSVSLINGAQVSNIFWQVGSSATLGTTSIFKGNILANISITGTTGTSLYGKALARSGAVTLDAVTNSLPTGVGSGWQLYE